MRAGALTKGKEIAETYDSLHPGWRPTTHHAKINIELHSRFPDSVYFGEMTTGFETSLHLSLIYKKLEQILNQSPETCWRLIWLGAACHIKTVALKHTWRLRMLLNYYILPSQMELKWNDSVYHAYLYSFLHFHRFHRHIQKFQILL